MKIFRPLFILFLALPVQAGQKAVTEEGSVVILMEDGTWAYENTAESPKRTITINDRAFVKNTESSFLLKSTKNNTAFWLDPKKWSFSKPDSGTHMEYQFTLKGGDLYGAAITEAIQVEYTALAQIALENAKKVAPDAKIVAQEYRNVNGKKLLYLEIQGVMKGINFTYFGYYFSDTAGTTQYILYTATNLAGKYKPEIDSFLNGFTTQS
jgi:hypothetical protein